LAAGYCYEAIVVKVAEIARMKPTVGDRLCGFFSKLMVALHDVSAAYHDFTDLARSEYSILIVPNRNLHARQRPADRSELSVSRSIQRYDGRRFRLSVPFIDRHAESFLECFRDGRRQRLTAGYGKSDGRRIQIEFGRRKDPVHR